MIRSLQSLPMRLGAAAVTWYLCTPLASAQIFGPIPDVGGTNDVRLTVLRILRTVLSFMALVAVVIIVIAGIRLIVSQGEDAEKDKAKKTIIYVVIGLIVILLAQAIVDFVASQIASNLP